MRIGVTVVDVGLHPDERIVEVATRDGPMQLPVHRRSLDAACTIDIGYPVACSETHYLVELPAETGDGRWRVWVDRATLGPPPTVAAGCG